MVLSKKLAELMDKYSHPLKVLDLWAGEWKYSIFCASYGDKVVAVDNESKKDWLRPDYLLNHPNISFIKWDIRELPDGVLSKKYDIVLLYNVIVFLKKKFFLESLLPQYIELLNKWWTISISFFFDDDEIMGKNNLLSFYSFEDFGNIDNITLETKDEIFVEENHWDIGKHTHHIGYIEIRKK